MGGLRSSAQNDLDELALGLSLIGVILICGTLRHLQYCRTTIRLVRHAVEHHLQPLGFILYLIAAIAETNRVRLICRRRKRNW